MPARRREAGRNAAAQGILAFRRVRGRGERTGRRTVHAPQLDLPVIGAGHDERQRWVERRPVDAPIVALQHVLHHGVAAAEQIRVHLQPLQPPAPLIYQSPSRRPMPSASMPLTGSKHALLLPRA